MTQPQTNPTEPTNPDGMNDANTEPQTVAFEQTSVTDPVTGDTVTETIAAEDIADANATTAIPDALPSAAPASGMTSDDAQPALGNPGAYNAQAPAYASASNGAPVPIYMSSSADAPDFTSASTSPTADAPISADMPDTAAAPTAVYTQTSAPAPETVDSMGNPYMAAPTSSPYGQMPPTDATAAPTYGTSGAAQQPPYGAPNAAQPAYGAPTTYYIARNKILAGLLALFFGMFGIHNFYLGYTGRGIAQLLLTVLGWIVLGLGPLAALIWSWIEGVRILTSDYGTPEHRDARGVELMD